jgi:hypothetical protein
MLGLTYLSTVNFISERGNSIRISRSNALMSGGCWREGGSLITTIFVLPAICYEDLTLKKSKLRGMSIHALTHSSELGIEHAKLLS